MKLLTYKIYYNKQRNKTNNKLNYYQKNLRIKQGN